MRSFTKAARTGLAALLALCMVLSLVTVSADSVTEITLGNATRLPDGYYLQEITVSGISSGYATVMVYAKGEEISPTTIKYINQSDLVDGAYAFTMEAPHGVYTVVAGGTDMTASTTETVLNTAPTVAVTAISGVKDDAAIGTSVATITASDVDNDEVALTIAENNYFEIAENAIVTKAAVPAGSYNLTVTASDGIATATDNVTVEIAVGIVTYDISAVAALDAIAVREGTTAESISLPAEVDVTYDTDKTATATITWPEAFEIPGTVEGTLTLPSIGEGYALANASGLKASVAITVIDETVTLTANGKAVTEYYNTLNTPVEIAVTYGNPDDATYAFVESDANNAAAPEEFAAATTYIYEGSAEAGTVYITVFVKDDDAVNKATVAIHNQASAYSADIYLNATTTNPTYSAYRINKAGSLTITGAIESLNGETLDGAAYEYSILSLNGEEVLKNSTGVFADLSTLANRANYIAKLALVSGGEELEAVKKYFYVADFSVWFTDYTVDRFPNRSGITINKNRTVNSVITFDAGDADSGEVYAGYILEDKDGIIATSDLEETENLVYSKELDLSSYANGAYTLYQVAKYREAQEYYDMRFGKTLYLYDKTALISNITANGSTSCALGMPEALTLKAKWYSEYYENIAPEGLTYKYEVFKYGEADPLFTKTVTDNADVVIDGEDLATLKANFKCEIVLTVTLPDDSVDLTYSKIVYPTL